MFVGGFKIQNWQRTDHISEDDTRSLSKVMKGDGRKKLHSWQKLNYDIVYVHWKTFKTVCKLNLKFCIFCAQNRVRNISWLIHSNSPRWSEIVGDALKADSALPAKKNNICIIQCSGYYFQKKIIIKFSSFYAFPSFAICRLPLPFHRFLHREQ